MSNALQRGGRCCGRAWPTFDALVQHCYAVHADWTIDVPAVELVRHSDGRRWDTGDVPELARSSRERNATRLDLVDAWVRDQVRLER